MIDSGKRQDVESRFTKYEIARILGARALQISMNAPVLIKLSKEQLESINYDSLKIAEAEFYEGILPITVKRPMPQKSADKITRLHEEVKKEEAKKEEVKKTEKKEEKLKEKPAEEAKKEPVKEKKETLEEEIIKEVEGTEVMELAKPDDEVESAEEPEHESGAVEE